eukprot:jgi/Ulvmu1/10844/UM007_0018.1
MIATDAVGGKNGTDHPEPQEDVLSEVHMNHLIQVSRSSLQRTEFQVNLGRSSLHQNDFQPAERPRDPGSDSDTEEVPRRYTGSRLVMYHRMETPLPDVGCQVWPAALLLADWLLAPGEHTSWSGACEQPQTPGTAASAGAHAPDTAVLKPEAPPPSPRPLRTVLELGGGVGLTAVVAAACGASVLLTDGLPSALRLARKNVAANAHLLQGSSGLVKVRHIDWTNLDGMHAAAPPPAPATAASPRLSATTPAPSARAAAATVPACSTHTASEPLPAFGCAAAAAPRSATVGTDDALAAGDPAAGVAAAAVEAGGVLCGVPDEFRMSQEDWEQALGADVRPPLSISTTSET